MNMSNTATTTKKPIANKQTNKQKDAPQVKAINAYIKTILNATPKEIQDTLMPTKLDIVRLSKTSRQNIALSSWQISHKELFDTIKKGYDAIESILIKRVGYKNSIGSMFLLKATFQYRENAITKENERIVINIGGNNGPNKI